MSTSDFLPARDDQKFAPGAWSKTYTLSGVSAVSASNWHAYIVRNKGDVQATASLIAPTVSVSVSANTVTFSLTATQVATLIGSGASKFAGYWSVYSDTLARTVVAGHFVIDRTATNSGTSSSPTTLTVTSTTSTLSVVVPTVTSTVLDTWNAARDAAATTVADIVCLTDSIGVLGSVTAKPWPHLLAKTLSAFDSRAEGAGWVFANGNGAAVIAMDSCAGTASTTGAGGYASDMTAGQVAYHTMTCDGVSVVYTKQSGGGSIEVRDGGSGGTLIQTISTANATTARSQVTTVDLTTYASRQVHLTVTGGPVHLEGIYGHAGDQTTGTRVWCPGHSGYTTGDFVTNTTLAMNLIATLDPALVIIATGFNDTNATTYEADLRSLVALVEAQTGNNVAIMSPWGGSDGVASDQAFALAAQTVAGDNDLAYFPLYEMLGAVGANIDPWDLSADGAHPRVGASQMIADLVLSKVAVDPDLVAISVPERGPRDYLGSVTNDQGTKGTVTVGATLGYPTISLSEASGDAQSSLAAINAGFAALLSLPGPTVAFGAGGSSALDTYLYRNSAGALKTNGTMTATAQVASGLTGATQASRYVGATASGAPASGTFAIGDFIIDRTGKVYICTTAGSPGTWTQAGNSGTVTSVSGTAPVQVATGTTTPVITIDAASDTARGVVELATDAETATGTDTARAVTPANVASAYPLKSATTGLVDAAGDLLVGTADNTLGKLAIGTALQVLRTNAGATALEWATPSGGGGASIYGDGQDGNLTVSGTTTIATDKYYDTLIVQNGGVLKVAGARIFCKTLCQVDAGGVIHANGNDGAAGGTAGAATSQGMLGAEAPGGAGGTGAGSVSPTHSNAYGGNGGAGGAGSGGAGGAASGYTSLFGNYGCQVPRWGAAVMLGHYSIDAVSTVVAKGGGGGGGGGGDGTAGGGGGSGGGAFVLAAKSLTNNGTISANGGNGGSPAAGNRGGGGGGGGGYIGIVYDTKTGSGTITATAGTGGTHTGTGADGSSGSAGTVTQVVNV